MQSLELLPAEADITALGKQDEDIAAIKDDLVWESSHVLTYLFKDNDQVNYHEIVQEVAEAYEIEESIIQNGSTFEIERRIMEEVFAGLWDQLPEDERTELLHEIDPDEK